MFELKWFTYKPFFDILVNIGEHMTIDSILEILKNILDVCLVWMIIYYILKNIKNNVKMTLLFKGVLIIIVLKLLANWLNLTTLNILLGYVITYGPLAIIIIPIIIMIAEVLFQCTSTFIPFSPSSSTITSMKTVRENIIPKYICSLTHINLPRVS